MKSDTRERVVIHESDHPDLIIVERAGDQDRILIALNFSASVVTWETQLEGRKLLDSASAEWLGPGEKTPAVVPQRSTLTLQPTSVIVLDLTK